MVTDINFLLMIPIHCQEIRLWELIKWSPKRKCFDLSSNSLNTFFKEIYRDQLGELVSGYWGLKGYKKVQCLACHSHLEKNTNEKIEIEPTTFQESGAWLLDPNERILCQVSSHGQVWQMYMASNLLIIIIIRNIENVLCGTVKKGGWYLISNEKISRRWREQRQWTRPRWDSTSWNR